MSAIKRRQLFMAIHRYIGLAALVCLTVAGLTGCILCFEKPIDRWLNPDIFYQKGSGVCPPLIAVVAFEQDHPGVVATYFQVHPIIGQNILVLVEARRGYPALGYDQLFLDGGDGHVVGTRRNRAGWDRAHIIRAVYDLHCTLMAGLVGRWVMGIAAFLWLVGSFVGVYITLPLNRASLGRWRRAWTLRRSRSLRQTLLDLHRVCGLWLLLPMSSLAFSSVSMNFFSELLLPAVAAMSPPRPSPFDQAPPTSMPAAAIDLVALLKRAEKMDAPGQRGWLTSSIQREPGRGLTGIRFTQTGYDEYVGLGPATDWFDGSGRLIYQDDPYHDSFGMVLERALYPLHTGQMIGWSGVLLDLLLGVVITFLSFSGLYLWWKRRSRHRAAGTWVTRRAR